MFGILLASTDPGDCRMDLCMRIVSCLRRHVIRRLCNCSMYLPELSLTSRSQQGEKLWPVFDPYPLGDRYTILSRLCPPFPGSWWLLHSTDCVMDDGRRAAPRLRSVATCMAWRAWRPPCGMVSAVAVGTHTDMDIEWATRRRPISSVFPSSFIP